MADDTTRLLLHTYAFMGIIKFLNRDGCCSIKVKYPESVKQGNKMPLQFTGDNRTSKYSCSVRRVVFIFKSPLICLLKYPTC